MSFILDALKKSERERQRQTGPALFEVKVAPPRNRFPLWAVVLGGLLLLNSGVVLWLLLHNSSKEPPGAAAAAPTASNNDGAMTGQPVNPGPYGTPSMGSPPPYDANSNPPPTSGGGAEYFGDPASLEGARPNPSRNTQDQEMLNPEDYEPAVEAPRPSRAASARKPPTDQKDTGSEEGGEQAEKGLPTYQDALAMPGMNMPQLRLDLHVYDPPDKSFVLVNMRKVKPGETIAQGVRVEQITPAGAILSYRGVRFLLHSE